MTTVLQINTNDAILADELLTNSVSQELVDLTLVSKQYKHRARYMTTLFADFPETAAVWIAG